MSGQMLPKTSPSRVNRLPDIFEEQPVLTSSNARWNTIYLESHHLPPGETPETPEFSLDHSVVAINVGQGFHAERRIDNSLEKTMFFQGAVVICPMHCRHSFRWERDAKTLSLNLGMELLNETETELLGTNEMELVPCFGVQDALIQQIGLALQTELRSHGMGGRLYSETMANALAVHLLQKYTSKHCSVQVYQGGLSHYKLEHVTDYIHDHLKHPLNLRELSAVAQLSPHHFSRAFKQSTGLSPHQYVI
ncbi:MAG TPA: AraC family transcriptional regulator [Elainellaceae cyanobacterium]